MRPRIMSLIVLFLILAATSAVAETVAGLPLHVKELAPDAIRVWIGDHISSTGTVAIATKEGLVIIDTTGNPEVDSELRDVIARHFGRDDFKFLINTHEHGDHTGGNSVYADCTIVGHELVEAGMNRSPEARQRTIDWLTSRIAEQETQLEEMADGTPEAARMREDLILNRSELRVAKSNAKLVPPTKTFSDRMELDLGDTTFKLYFIGGMHSPSDIAILVPERGLLMTGDTMADVWLTDTPGCLASFMARSGVRHDFPMLLKNWNAILKQKKSIKTLVTGHWNGELTLAGCENRVRYVETLWTAAKKSSKTGLTLDRMLAEYRLDARFPDLVDSPGCNERNNSSTIMEIWTEASGQKSGAQALYDVIDKKISKSAIRKVMAERDSDSSKFYFVEAQINALGYRFLQNERADEAVAMFRVNVEFFPESWNVYDSLGEALLLAGEREEGIAMYERSIELNAENTNGIEVLERIRSESAVN